MRGPQNAAQAQALPAADRQVRPEGSPPLILLVEDTLDDELMAVRALRKLPEKPEILVARTGEEALRCLMGDPADGFPPIRPDLVLLDLKLPKISGHEVLEQCRASERTRDLPVVVLTSSDDPIDIERAEALGASDYVRKPIDFDKYMEVVTSAARKWLPSGPG